MGSNKRVKGTYEEGALICFALFLPYPHRLLVDRHQNTRVLGDERKYLKEPEEVRPPSQETELLVGDLDYPAFCQIDDILDGVE
eukprot:CAMPEP_0185253338 /NCGR_PEP_ID=MMETSP1359-20130426/2135_1 /TAXON_ID=552665 /ORGANISM="Bigelowiella longifila, Strain CCMP242" /LENGTH=83 /DNA_ID=CAMNT_0027835705 /DNA_START=293 /DNA_END=544 /DNA_ORIENTATION=+